MATATRAPRRAADGGVTPYRLTVAQFEAMIAGGILSEDDRVELLGGLLAEKMTKNAPHQFALGRLRKVFEQRVGGDWLVLQESAVRFGRTWRPEPDLAVVVGPDDRYRANLPAGADVRLVAEVSETTYETDRGVKWRGYAAARVPGYWVVNLESRAVEVYSGPAGRGRTARYETAAVYGAGEAVPLRIDGRDFGRIAVSELLP